MVTLAALAMPVAASPALAQSQSLKDWSLPAPDPSQTAPAAQGPVDPQHPVLRPVAPDIQASAPAPASPTPAPLINAPPPPPAATHAAPGAASRPHPAVPHSLPPAPVAGNSAPAPQPSPEPQAETQPAAPSANAPTIAGENTQWPAWWWAIPAAPAALALAFLLMRRRSASATEEEAGIEEKPEQIELPVEPAPEPAPPVRESIPPPIPAPAFARARAAEPAPSSQAIRARGEIAFEPVAMRLSLVYATLQFRVRLTAQTEIPAGRLLADMISAHGSLPQSMQLAPPPEALGAIQAIAPLAPGQVQEMKGELQLPLNAIRPVHHDGASFMVPLVRLALLGSGDPALPHLEIGCVFTVGIPGAGPALAPLRLDTGPREFTSLAAREIETARRTVLLGLDPARAAG